jgi:UPF0716 family protein affecting phage T7 exclusion
VPAPTRPSPPPLQVDTVRVVVAGTALWAVALIVLLLLGDQVDRVWTWTCIAAIVLAALGLGLMRWQGASTSSSSRTTPRPGDVPDGR